MAPLFLGFPSSERPFACVILAVRDRFPARPEIPPTRSTSMKIQQVVRTLARRLGAGLPALLVGLGLFAVAPTPAAVAQEPQVAVPGGRDWIVKAENNICGLSDAAQLSNPVVVDFQALLDATPEYKKMKDQKISATSPEGIRLNNEAVNRIATQCEAVRAANGYCSVWKEVKHKDGRAITDVTEKVKALL